MKAVGIICEYNPFHNGHVYHIQKVKERFPDSILVLVLNGYFSQRGEVSYLPKYSKAKLALEHGVDLVVSLPFVYGTQAADIFAEKALEILHHFQVSDVVFGSECNDIDFLMKAAKKQLELDYSSSVQSFLDQGDNYPTALSKAIDFQYDVIKPNDLLGISYAKAILKNHWNIQLHTILRTSDFHDEVSKDPIISASNIRNKILNHQDIQAYVPQAVLNELKMINENKIWSFLKFRILTDPHLEQYLTVDEGIETHLKKKIGQAHHLDEYIHLIKTRRYTYNRLHRMMAHLLLGFTKEDHSKLKLDYLQILGFSLKGQAYLKEIRKEIALPFKNRKSKIYQYELKAALLYDEITNSTETIQELRNKPVVK